MSERGGNIPAYGERASMKNGNACPKCQSPDVLGIPARWGEQTSLHTGLTVFSEVDVSRWVCSSCGYIEHWVESKVGLEKLKGALD
jgi:hypothetical protein